MKEIAYIIIEIFSESQLVFIILGLAICYRVFHILNNRRIDNNNPRLAKLFLKQKGMIRSYYIRVHQVDGKRVHKHVAGLGRYIYLDPGEHTLRLSYRKDTSLLIATAFRISDLINIRLITEAGKEYIADLDNDNIVINEI